MLRSAVHNPGLRRRRLVVLTIVTVLLLISAITYALLTRDKTHTAQSSTPPPATAPEQSTGPMSPPDDGTLPELLPVADPEQFAELMAHAIFDWETTSLAPRAAYLQRIVTVADPTGESSPGLISDVDAYLPPEKIWIDLREYETRQWIEVETIEVPTEWDTALDQASGALAPGTTAYTITGVRHRDGVWEGEPVASQHEVAFTVFMTCAPTYEQCRLLRLSLLDEPLG